MTVKLAILKSGEDIVADIKEMASKTWRGKMMLEWLGMYSY